MTVTLTLKPEIEAVAKARADAQHIALEDYLNAFLERNLPTTDQEEIRRRNIERNAGAIALLRSWAKEDDPEVIEDQRETLDYLKRAIDEDRPGQRRVFGEGYNP